MAWWRYPFRTIKGSESVVPSWLGLSLRGYGMQSMQLARPKAVQRKIGATVGPQLQAPGDPSKTNTSAVWEREADGESHPGSSVGGLSVINGLVTAKRQPMVSDQIHVLGSDARGKYVLQALSSYNALPPVRFIIHERSTHWKWVESDRQIYLFQGDNRFSSSRIIPEFTERLESTSHRRSSPEYLHMRRSGPIDQLIVTVPASSVVHAIAEVRDRINSNTIICLIQEGMGLPEALNEALFSDVAERPMYVLGHLSKRLYPGRGDWLAVREEGTGHLYLTALQRDLWKSRFRIHPPVEHQTRTKHFLELMTLTPGLGTRCNSFRQFLANKLPVTVFRSVADPLTVTLNCGYHELLDNKYARQLMDQLLGEIVSVILRLPELRGHSSINEFRIDVLRKAFHHWLIRQKGTKSRLFAQIKRGRETDIEFFNGYFVKRGRDVGVKCPTNETIMWMVKAANAANATQETKMIPWEQ